jgi:hypothetical protein
VTAPGAEDCAHPEEAVAIMANAAVGNTNLTRRRMVPSIEKNLAISRFLI